MAAIYCVLSTALETFHIEFHFEKYIVINYSLMNFQSEHTCVTSFQIKKPNFIRNPHVSLTLLFSLYPIRVYWI